MKHENVLENSLNPGRFYKIIQPIGPIPAGVYRFECVDEGSMTFSVGHSREIVFSIAYLTPEIVSEVSYSIGKRSRIRASEFTEHYFENVDRIPSHWSMGPQPENGPALTFCFIPIEQSLLARGPLLEKLFKPEVASNGWHKLFTAEFDA
jgi:hypothetical protein